MTPDQDPGIFRAIVRGCGYVEGYGHHPGTPWLLFMVVLGWIIAGSFWGALIMFGIFAPPYLYGAYMRGKNNG